MSRLIIAILIIAGAWYAWSWYKQKAKSLSKGDLARIGLTALAVIAVLLVVTGKAHWIVALFGALLPILQRVWHTRGLWMPVFNFLKGRSAQQQNGSTIETQYLRMSLDHRSGQLSGVVLHGPYSGQTLESMALADLINLLHDCRINDDESARLLETFLDRQFTDWRDDEQSTSSSGQYTPSNGKMSVEEAYAILGLQNGASESEIRRAHKSLMQKFHPDRGGSDYLATKINEAKRILMDLANQQSG